jgi:hypothetical protein
MSKQGNISYWKRTALCSGACLLISCSQHQHIPPDQSDKPCIKNFESSGNIITGQVFKTTSVLRAVKRGATFNQILKRLPEIGFRHSRSDRSLGIIEAAHESTLAGGGNRAVKLTVRLEQNGNDVKIGLFVATHPGQITATGDLQHELCQVIEASQVESFEY